MTTILDRILFTVGVQLCRAAAEGIGQLAEKA